MRQIRGEAVAIGTNYYLRRVRPREVHDQMHLCKASAGWRVHFQDSTCGFETSYCDDEPPGVHSVADVRSLLATREWQLADECGEVWAPGEESMCLLDELCARWPDGRENRALGGDYRDPEGYWWTPTDFR